MLSRVADSLYWMSRYLERAEHTARLVDVSLNLMLEQDPKTGAEHQKLLLQSLNIKLGEGAPSLEDGLAIARVLTFDTGNPNSVVSCIMTARENARQVREQISSEMYEQLNRLYLRVRDEGARAEWDAQPYEFFADVKEGAHLFQGVTDDTMSHGQAWQFIRIGRDLERVGATVRLLQVHCPSFAIDDASLENYGEWVGLLKSCTCFEAYCKQYTAEMLPRRIIEFLLLDDEMPRSVRFCTERIERVICAISEDTGRPSKNTKLMRAAGTLRARLDFCEVDGILNQGLTEFLAEVAELGAQIHSALFSTYIRYTVETSTNAV
ncbi:alpha-E domain-containing protein [Abditibacterium utsteinense]|nr:alpha-E domain-containing protein [Abditibacterium utsteinense]